MVLTSGGEPTELALKSGGLFRADIFSQNEVEGIADRTTSQLELIDSFEAERIAAWNTQIGQAQTDLVANAQPGRPL